MEEQFRYSIWYVTTETGLLIFFFAQFIDNSSKDIYTEFFSFLPL